MNGRRFLAVAALLLAAHLPASAIAQQYQTLPPNSVVGNNSNRSNPGFALSFSELSKILNFYSLTKIGNSDYTIFGTDRVVSTDSQVGGWDGHTWTLPRAADYNPGQLLYVADLGSKVTNDKPLIIVRSPIAGNDTINGSIAPVTINATNGAFVFISDGYSNWLAQTLTSSSTMPDGTIKSNVSGAAAAPSDNSISAVLDKLFGTTRGSVVYRGASTWSALPPGLIGQLLSSNGAGTNPSWITADGTGTVTSIACGTGLSGGTVTTSGTCALNVDSSTVNASPSNPTGSTSASPIMMGLGVTTCRITPKYSTRVFVSIQGTITNNTGGSGSIYLLRAGTGTGPANGVAATGTALTNTMTSAGSGTTNPAFPFNASGIFTGATVGTAVWFDIALGASANTATIASLTCTAHEVM